MRKMVESKVVVAGGADKRGVEGGDMERYREGERLCCLNMVNFFILFHFIYF